MESRWQRLRRRPLFLLVSILLHLGFAGGATYYVVATSAPPRKVAFQFAPGPPAAAARPAIEHRVQVARQKKLAAAPPPALKRLSVSGPAKIALPEMPDLGSVQPSARQPTTMTGGGTSFVQGPGSGTGGGLGGKMGGGPGGAAIPISFFGIRDAGQSVVIMIDVSDSMFTRTGDATGRALVKRGAQQSFRRFVTRLAGLSGHCRRALALASSAGPAAPTLGNPRSSLPARKTKPPPLPTSPPPWT